MAFEFKTRLLLRSAGKFVAIFKYIQMMNDFFFFLFSFSIEMLFVHVWRPNESEIAIKSTKKEGIGKKIKQISK